MKPWLEGPTELLRHAFDQMATGTGFGYRIAIICIDNAVELSIKTYLGLPKRITGVEGLGRKALRDISESFPALLDALEGHAPDKITDIELGDIEWFHRTRNNLYHDGNGITVERTLVESYAAVARILIKNLFGEDVSSLRSHAQTKVGELLELWVVIENELRRIGDAYGISTRTSRELVDELARLGLLKSNLAEQVGQVRVARNRIAHHAGPITAPAIAVQIISAKNLVQNLRQIAP